MLKHPSIQLPDDSLPWYVNHTLPDAERAAVEGWLTEDPAASTRFAAVDSIRSAVYTQPKIAPAPAVRQQLLARLPNVRRSERTHAAWLIGPAIAVVILIALWAVVQPGITLQWSVEGDTALAYRVYRAPVDSTDFNLLREVPAQPDARTYTFTDLTSLPGQTYSYRVEAVTPDGESVLSQTVIGHGLDILPAQLALVLTSIVAGLATMVLITNSAQFPAHRRPLGA